VRILDRNRMEFDLSWHVQPTCLDKPDNAVVRQNIADIVECDPALSGLRNAQPTAMQPRRMTSCDRISMNPSP
jgi:hypothetical protein